MGIISALLLGLAGASARTIAGDYALSARYLVDRYRQEMLGGEGSSCTWKDVQREWCPLGSENMGGSSPMCAPLA